MGQGHIHDFNPGIAPSGLFWTAHVPVSSVEIDFGRTTASFQLKDFALLDTIPNVAATVSLSMEWHGERAEIEVKDPCERVLGPLPGVRGHHPMVRGGGRIQFRFRSGE